MTNKTALEIGEELRQGKLSPDDYLKQTLEKIKDDTHNAFLYTMEPTAKIPKASSSLSGAGVALADNILVKGQLGTGGSQMLHNFIPPYGATVVDKLAAGGLSIIGKTNLPEFGMGTSGSDAAFGPVLNPYAEDKISEGAAAAVALGLVPLALSVDSLGNPRKFAGMTGVACLKPTYGTVSRFGIIPYLESSEVVAVTANKMADAASLFNLISGNDEKDGTTYSAQSYELELENTGIAGFKVALPNEYFTDEVSQEVKDAIGEFCQSLQELGAEISRVDFPLAAYAHLALQTMAAAEGANNISRYDGIKYGYQSETNGNLEDIYFKSRSEAFQTEAKRTAILGAYLLSKGQYEESYLKALQIRRLVNEQVKGLFTQYDLLLAPAARTFAYELKDTAAYYEDNWLDSLYTAVPSLTGIPAAVLPMGKSSQGLPMGVQLMADTLQEAKLVKLALACGL